MKKSSKETDKLKWETDGVFTRISGVNSTNKIENLTHVKSKVPKSHFNRRVMAHQEKNEIYFQIHDVYYTKGVADSYTENGVRVGGDSIEEIRSVLERMIECLDKPILWYGDKFPAEYNPKGKKKK
jgi:hypothetical protein